MQYNFLDLKAMKMASQTIDLQPGDVLFSLQPTLGGQLALDAGLPIHRIYSAPAGVVSFGLQRLQKQEERNAATSIASQVYNFINQNPKFVANRIFRPIYDLGPDDALGIILFNPEVRAVLFPNRTTLLAILMELNEFAANRYNFVRDSTPRFLNNFLNTFQFPFKEVQAGSSKVEACFQYLMEMTDWFLENIETLTPSVRTFPADLSYSVHPDATFKTDRSVLLVVDDIRYGSDYLAAQMYFTFNPNCIRVITARKMRNSVKHNIIVHNANMVDENLIPYEYPAVKELNTLEHNAGGDSNWKNLKINVVGPPHGSDLPLTTIWDKCKL
jgi:hypothetical protein